jgi:hypothetical protein
MQVQMNLRFLKVKFLMCKLKINFIDIETIKFFNKKFKNHDTWQ